MPIMHKLKMVAIIFFSFVFVMCCAWLIFYYIGSYKNLKDLQSLAGITDPNVTQEQINSTIIDYRSLYCENSEMIGWVRIDNTQIDLPVMYSPNDGEFYLTHGFDKNESRYGVPFVDERCVINPRSTNILIHGHHMADGMMFSNLVEYESEDFYKKHPIIEFDTIYKKAKYEIIAAFKSQIYGDDEDVFKYYDFINTDDEDEYNDYIRNVKELCPYNTHKTAKFKEDLITLSTCSYHTKDGRFAVVAKKIKS